MAKFKLANIKSDPENLKQAVSRNKNSSADNDTVENAGKGFSRKTNNSRPNSLLLLVAVIFTIVAVVNTGVLVKEVFSYINDLTVTRTEKTTLKIVESKQPHISALDAQMRQINPDYICWMTIDDTEIDYPVVRGQDNERYLNTSFYGEDNIFGTLFMDYRCIGEYVPHIIIYGHNSRHGDMFGGLRKFLDDEYMREHPVIRLKVNDRIVEYEIFSARKTNVNDPAYALDFNTSAEFRNFAERVGAPGQSTQILTLSTCVSGNDKDERVIVQAYLLAN